MRWIEIPRTGDLPLRFRGERLTFRSSRRLSGEDETRWHEVAAYRTDDGRYVVHVGWRTVWQAEAGANVALLVKSAEEAAAALEAAVPRVRALPGYPPLPHLEQKRDELERDVMARFREALLEVLESLCEEEPAPGRGAGPRAERRQAPEFGAAL